MEKEWDADPSKNSWVLDRRRHLLSNVNRAEPGLYHLVCMSFFLDFLCRHILDSPEEGGVAQADSAMFQQAVAQIFRPFLGVTDPGHEVEEGLAWLVGEAFDIANDIEQFNENHGPHASLWFEMPDPEFWQQDDMEVTVLGGEGQYEGEALPTQPALRWTVGAEEGTEVPGAVTPVALRWR
jgi:hypothetical protein